MPNSKPTLASTIIRRHLWAASLTLGALMLVLLAVTDQVSLRMHCAALAREVRAVPAPPVLDEEACCASMGRQGNGGRRLLDEHGCWMGGNGRGPGGERPPLECWSQSPEVLRTGESSGMGYLPWSPEPVVWAARVISTPDAQRGILVRWDRISAIRDASKVTYGAVILATLLAFGVSIMLALRSARYVTGVLDGIADSGARMAAGDFSVRLPEQPTAELDRVSTAISRLAEDLDHTTTDLQAERTRLEQLEKMQRQFVADASHELRAPLTAMRVTLEAWQDGVLRADEQPEALAHLLRENERLAALVTHLLDLSRIESGREPVTLSPVALAEVIETVRATFPPETGAPIHVALSDVPPVLADRQALHRVLQNLLENARRFTPATGTIRITATREGDVLVLAVADTGTGIAPEELPCVWDRFARAASARSAGNAGSGLGLAIVKALVEAMGGTVDAESAPGAGTTMSLRLRIAPEDLSQA